MLIFATLLFFAHVPLFFPKLSDCHGTYSDEWHEAKIPWKLATGTRYHFQQLLSALFFFCRALLHLRADD
jgi:hypothetical protein